MATLTAQAPGEFFTSGGIATVTLPVVAATLPAIGPVVTRVLDAPSPRAKETQTFLVAPFRTVGQSLPLPWTVTVRARLATVVVEGLIPSVFSWLLVGCTEPSGQSVRLGPLATCGEEK